MAIPDGFQQSLEILIVEEGEGFSRWAHDSERSIVQASNVVTGQDALSEETEAITGIMRS